MDIASGVVSIEYSHFYITEHIETGLEGVDQTPDFYTDEPVIITPASSRSSAACSPMLPG
ncbi:hypothetical protein ACFH04_09510 [Streptomyces noboritoensis]|uniref:Uncharacterized protein n=1 Tax=Streptomyces noboritoensis TaxID=67337 RepID=A0ABV6TDR5_9ACTN